MTIFKLYSPSWTTPTLGSCIRIPLKAWMYVHVFLCPAVLCRQRSLAIHQVIRTSQTSLSHPVIKSFKLVIWPVR